MRLLSNPPNPYVGQHAEWLEPPPAVQPRVYVERARSILSENDSPDLNFRWSVNPYRGCQHACAYCYARPTHEYLGWGAGTDFDTQLVAKENAPELLAQAFKARRWRGERVAFSGVTDCYQPIEAVWELTRRCLEVCVAARNPACVVTKAYLIRRDVDVLTELNRVASASVCISLAFADEKLSRLMEPHAAPPARRLEALRVLADAGVHVGVLFAPIIPGLNDDQIPQVLSLAADAGARFASYVALRLPGSTEQVFIERLRRDVPLRADRVLHRQRETRGGTLNESAFGQRMHGRGTYWQSIEQLFLLSCQRHGLLRPPCDTATPSCGDAGGGGAATCPNPAGDASCPSAEPSAPLVRHDADARCERAGGAARTKASPSPSSQKQMELPFMRGGG